MSQPAQSAIHNTTRKHVQPSHEAPPAARAQAWTSKSRIPRGSAYTPACSGNLRSGKLRTPAPRGASSGAPSTISPPAVTVYGTPLPYTCQHLPLPPGPCSPFPTTSSRCIADRVRSCRSAMSGAESSSRGGGTCWPKRARPLPAAPPAEQHVLHGAARVLGWSSHLYGLMGAARHHL